MLNGRMICAARRIKAMTARGNRRIGLQRGEGKVGTIVSLLLLIISIMVAVKMIPVKIADTEFQDFMDDQAKFAGHRKADTIRKAILEHAKAKEIPLEKKNLLVKRPGDRVKIECSYTVPVEFPFGYTYNWTFEHRIDRAVFIF
jgi:hypothetical protein